MTENLFMNQHVLKLFSECNNYCKLTIFENGRRNPCWNLLVIKLEYQEDLEQYPKFHLSNSGSKLNLKTNYSLVPNIESGSRQWPLLPILLPDVVFLGHRGINKLLLSKCILIFFHSDFGFVSGFHNTSLLSDPISESRHLKWNWQSRHGYL